MNIALLSLGVTIFIAVAASAWKLAVHIRGVELQVSNHLKHDILRLEEKIDVMRDKVYEIKEEIASCPIKKT
jgi:hypothetical protein